MQNFIKITNLKVFAHHGVFPEETRDGQDFFVNATLFLDMKEAGKTDNLEASVHYGEVCLFIDRFLKEHTYKLLEAASYHTMKALFAEFPLIQKMKFELCKPNAPIPLPFETVSVTMEMAWHKTYLALGSNMGEKEETIAAAVEKLQKDSDFRKVRCSKLIITKPYGGVAQDDFINGALEVETLLEPYELLNRIHELEKEAGRERKVHWGPRTLDLDILFYDNQIVDETDLVIPHPDLQNRDFVLKPMLQLAPKLRHPVLGKTIEELLSQLRPR